MKKMMINQLLVSQLQVIQLAAIQRVAILAAVVMVVLAVVAADVLAVATETAQEAVMTVVLAIATAVAAVVIVQDVSTCNNITVSTLKRRVVFIVTEDCQLRCKYCYLVNKNSQGRMSWETAKRIVDFLLTLPSVEETVVFDFIGGEPLLEIELIEKICDYIVSEMQRLKHKWLQNFSFRITTNGLLYSSERVQNFIYKYKDKLDIKISIDGNKRKNDINRVFPNGIGSYDKLLPNVKLWIEQFGDVDTLAVISHDDLPYVAESVIHLIELGLKKIYLSLVVEDVWKPGDGIVYEEQLQLIADYLLQEKLEGEVVVSVFSDDYGKPDKEEYIHPCGNPMYVFDSKGDIYTCVRFAEYSLRTKLPRIIGNIATGIDNNKLRPLLAYDRKSAYPQKCLECEIATGCRWCPAENYDASPTGTIFQRTTTVCEMHKAQVRMRNYYLNKLALAKDYDRQ